MLELLAGCLRCKWVRRLGEQRQSFSLSELVDFKFQILSFKMPQSLVSCECLTNSAETMGIRLAPRGPSGYARQRGYRLRVDPYRSSPKLHGSQSHDQPRHVACFIDLVRRSCVCSVAPCSHPQFAFLKHGDRLRIVSLPP